MFDDLIDAVIPGLDDMQKAKVKQQMRVMFGAAAGIKTMPGPKPTPMPIGAGGIPWWAIALIAYIVVEK